MSFLSLISFSSISAPTSPCTPKLKPAARLVVGECISQQEVQQESCTGFCPSFEELDPITGDVSAKECSCCAPDTTYSEPVIMDCRNATTGKTEQQTTQITRIRSCKCATCLGGVKKSYSNGGKTYSAGRPTSRPKGVTKTRRR